MRALSLEQKWIIGSGRHKCVKFKMDWGKNEQLTFASSMALEGIKMRGNAYKAPWRGLQLIPGTVLNMSSVSLAFSARLLRTDSFSCSKGRCSAWHSWSGNKNARENEDASRSLPWIKCFLGFAEQRMFELQPCSGAERHRQDGVDGVSVWMSFVRSIRSWLDYRPCSSACLVWLSTVIAEAGFGFIFTCEKLYTLIQSTMLFSI